MATDGDVATTTNTTTRERIVPHWILTDGRAVRSMEELIDGLAEQLLKIGVPVDRICAATTLLHPQTAAFDWTWESKRRHEEVAVVRYSYQEFEKYFDDKDNALMRLYHGEPFLRFHKDRPDEIPEDYRDLFVSQGYVDGYGLACIPGLSGVCAAVTWETKNLEGFTETHIAIFDAMIEALSSVIEIQTNHLSTGFLLQAYLGRDAGRRVHQGAVQRGDGTTIRAAVWFSDVRGFTRLSNIIPRDKLLDLLNSVFEVTVDVLEAHGGEVLKFMGDGLMGVFPDEDERMEAEGPPVDSHRSQCCQSARAAAVELQQRLNQVRMERSERGLPVATVGVGLHYGDVSYGNIGAPNRLDFTVIGSAVNLASRVESLCGPLGASVLATEAFMQKDNDENRGEVYATRGHHRVKGVEYPIEVFELAT